MAIIRNEKGQILKGSNLNPTGNPDSFFKPGKENIACREDIRQKIRRALTGKIHSDAHITSLKEAYKRNPKMGFQKGHPSFTTNATRGRFQRGDPRITGENNVNWRGGVSPWNKTIAASAEWRTWRGVVFERDDYTCQGCSKRGGCLEPHHIKPKRDFPNLVFDVENGVTLCRLCHPRGRKQGD